MKAWLALADRYFTRVMVVAWLLIYAGIVWRFLESGFTREASGGLLAYAIVFVIVLSGLVAAVVTAVVIAMPLRIALNLAIAERRHTRRNDTLTLTAILILLWGWFFEVQRERRALAPPAGATTLASFASAMPPGQWIRTVFKDGRQYFAWWGEWSGPLDVASGRSCYLFNDHGTLVDWQAETGDGGPVESFLKGASHPAEISLREALAAIVPEDDSTE